MNNYVCVKDVSEADLTAIEHRADAATHGPWHVRHLDDDWATSFIAVSTKPDSDGSRTARWPAWSGSENVAATLVQTPNHYVALEDGCWEANAEFIAHARSDVPQLLAEVRRLRTEVAVLKAKLEVRDWVVNYIQESLATMDDALAALQSVDSNGNWTVEEKHGQWYLLTGDQWVARSVDPSKIGSFAAGVAAAAALFRQ
jgi:hypothetical protein